MTLESPLASSTNWNLNAASVLRRKRAPTSLVEPSMTSSSSSRALPSPADLLTRRQQFDRIVACGYTMSWSTFTKLCAAGEGPPDEWCWGHVRLYTEAGGLEWARSRMRAGAGNLQKRKRAA